MEKPTATDRSPFGTQSFITVLIKAHHWSLFSARQIKSKLFYPISLISILILSSHLSPASYKWFLFFRCFTHSFLTRGLPSHPPSSDHPNNNMFAYKSWSSSLQNFLQPPVASSFQGPNTFFTTLLSNILSLCSSLEVKRSRFASIQNNRQHQTSEYYNLYVFRFYFSIPNGNFLYSINGFFKDLLHGIHSPSL